MPPSDLAIPTLPSRSVSETLAFYRRLGFDGEILGTGDSYAVLRRGTLELHFFTHAELRPAESAAGCYLRVSDVEAIYRDFSQAQLLGKGIPRLDALADKLWGLREFALVAPDGNLLRIGQIVRR